MSAYRLGFLLCDRPIADLAARFGDYPQMFARAFGAAGDAIEWRVYDAVRGELPSTPGECHGFLVSGSRHGAYDELPWLAPLARSLRDLVAAERPLVGLCFGHQMIAHALGGEVRRAPQGWGLGIHEYEVTAAEPWMRPARSRFVVPVCHRDQVLRLPSGARRLARSAHCENFVVRFGERALGIQGHPEFERDFVGALIEWRRGDLSRDAYAAARASLPRRHDNAVVKRWIMRFLGVPQGRAS